ncbi:MAG: cadherin-like domain-containing protein, partial [Alphaproteobacteria bacterium]|nr:cadherin-like domain-containing protein [Alphaproteobacteria bacterium]
MKKTFKIGLFFGGFGPDVIDGTANSDVIFGGFGNDRINSGAGRDRVFGGFGDDTILGAAGSDTIFGGAGTDTAVYEGGVDDYAISVKPVRGSGPTQVQVSDASGDTDTLRSIEQLYFAADDYTADLTGQNNAVLARDDVAAAAADMATVLAGLSDNDFDFDGDTLQITAIDTSALTGTATLNPDGTISYDAAGAFDDLAEGEVATTTLSYTVTDGRGSVDTATMTITVTGVNDAPTLDLSDVMVFENSTTVLTAVGADVDGDALTYSISGADAALFVIDPATGALAFAEEPDFEAPSDLDGDNVYQVAVTATDTGGLSATSDIAVTVTDLDDTPQNTVFISEIHYDNAGADTGEFIEVAGTAGTDLTGWSLVLYNGNGGASYDTISLDGALSGTSGQGYLSVNATGIQNG